MRVCEQFKIIIVVWYCPTVRYKASEGPGAARLTLYVNTFEHNQLILAPFEHKV